ncbi:MAG: O-antigen ligase family protein [Candidatus Competibacteraceae bacterium]
MSDIKPNRAADPGAVLFYGLVALLVFAPLFWAGNWPLPLLIMELAALVLLVWRFWSPLVEGQPLSRPVWIFLTLLFLLPLAQLWFAPFGLWADLPGRAFYAEALRQTSEGADLEWRAISLIPTATEATWLALLPPLAVFLATIHLTNQHVLRLVLVFLGIATVQALLGLIQYGDGPNSVFRFGNTWMRGSVASGTYINRNHLAGLLEMALPVGLALLAATVGHGQPPHADGGRGRRGRTFRQWLARFSVARINQAALFGAGAIAILLGLIFTRSRTGVGMAMLGILLCTLTFSHRLGGRNVYGLIGTFTAVGVGLASLIGLAPVLSRFTLQDPLADGRWKIYDATVQAIGEFFPLGSGGGTFENVMRRFHPADFPGVTINRAHNDYLEWLLEFGLMAAVLIAAWLLFYARQWGRVWKRGEWAPFRFAQAGAGIALLLMMLHSLADFNLRIPANAVFTAFLAAVFFHRPPDDERRRSSQRREAAREGDGKPPSASPIPPENQANPFSG